jgi:glycosyltransferase involved in cell wall biosynthesis
MKLSISVIIPTFNRIDVLPKAIESVLAQTIIPDEIIVVDDGSTDGTAEMIQSDYPKVSVLVQENAGVSSARNAGISVSKGDWIALLDSDDEWFQKKLERQM